MTKIDLSLNNFAQNGCADLGTILDQQKSSSLRDYINQNRPVNESIFYKTKAEFEEKGRWTGYAPGRVDRNFLLTDGCDLSFIENNPVFIDNMIKLCGENYSIMKKAIIRSVPGWAIPEWTYEYVKDVGRPNLNPFVHDEFQDVQYFHCTDFHQDKTRRESDFVTVYIYLDEVDADYSALRILIGSHNMGMTCYPHGLRRSMHSPDKWFYSDSIGNNMPCEQVTVTGVAGSIFSFHSLTLHGTVLNNSKNPRISLRYLVAPSKSKDTQQEHLLSEANSEIHGPQFIVPNRIDVEPGQPFLQTGSSLLSYE